MEQHVIWVVQFWVERYEFWSDCAEPAEGMFSLPRVGFEQEDDGQRKLADMREACPAGKYRLVRRTTTQEVMG